MNKNVYRADLNEVTEKISDSLVVCSIAEKRRN